MKTIILVFSSKTCYECKPEDSGKCLSPDQNNITTVNCAEKLQQVITSTQQSSEYQCFTVLTANGKLLHVSKQRKLLCDF